MKKSLIFFSVIFCVCFLAGVWAAAQTASGDESVSLNFEERPLSEVLAMITKITGHAFIIDAQWLDMPVSISVEATPLHKVLKYIFTDINNAIIYKSDGNIKIVVYSEIPEKDKASVSQGTASPEESESSQEAAPENETGNSVDSAEEGGAQPDKEQESADEETDDTAAGTVEERSESTEGGTH